MGDNLRDVNYADFGSANCNVFLSGCAPDQPIYVPSSLSRYQNKKAGESCYNDVNGGYCESGLYCDRTYTCRRLPWTPPPTNIYPQYLYDYQQGRRQPGPPNHYNVLPLRTTDSLCQR